MNDSYRAHGSEPYHSSNLKSVVHEFLEIEERSENEPLLIPATRVAGAWVILPPRIGEVSAYRT